MIRATAMLLALLLPAAALASPYRLPLDGCDQPTGCQPWPLNLCYVTAYMDHAGKDWYCDNRYLYAGHRGSDYGVGGVHGVRPVVAGNDGVVTERNDGCADHNTTCVTTCGGGFGNYVKLQHADGQITIYGHMANGSVAVQLDQSVTCGQLLGKVSSSGCSTGPHLHFEVVDPQYGSDDPYAGGCGGPISYWIDQGAHCGLPGASGCSAVEINDAGFVEETILDDTHFQPGASFTKTWTMRNSGTTTWSRPEGFRWVFDGQEQLGAASPVELAAQETVPPGQQKVWSVAMTAPATAGTYRGYWRMDQTANGRFGDQVWVQIVVDPQAGVDADGDGHASLATGGDDCDDADRQVYPGKPEACDGKDNDCNGAVDDGLTRSCFSPCPGTETCADGDWGECDAPAAGVEACNGRDDDCDGWIDEDAICDEGYECKSGLCLPVETEPLDAGLPPYDAGLPVSQDAGVPGRDAGSAQADSGPALPGSDGGGSSIDRKSVV